MSNNVKNVAIVLLVVSNILFGALAANKDGGRTQILEKLPNPELVELARSTALQGETDPVSNVEVHLTYSEEWAVVTFDQNGEDWAVTVKLEDVMVEI